MENRSMQLLICDNRVLSRSGKIENWLLGCGAVIVVCLVLCAGAAFWGFGFIAEKAGEFGKELQTFVENESHRQSFQTRWNAPTPDAKAAALFPEKVGEFTRSGAVDEVILKEQGLVTALPHARYTDGSRTVDVYFDRMSPQERRATFISVIDKIKAQQNGFHTTQGEVDSDRLYFQQSNPQQTAWLWWQKGWMVISISPSDYDSEPLLRGFLMEVQGPAPVEMVPAEAPAEAQAPPITVPMSPDGAGTPNSP